MTRGSTSRWASRARRYRWLIASLLSIPVAVFFSFAYSRMQIWSDADERLRLACQVVHVGPFIDELNLHVIGNEGWRTTRVALWSESCVVDVDKPNAAPSEPFDAEVIARVLQHEHPDIDKSTVHAAAGEMYTLMRRLRTGGHLTSDASDQADQTNQRDANPRVLSPGEVGDSAGFRFGRMILITAGLTTFLSLIIGALTRKSRQGHLRRCSRRTHRINR